MNSLHLPRFSRNTGCLWKTAGAVLREVATEPDSFQIDFGRLEAAVSENTKAVIVNSPNNPSGVVFRKESVRRLAELLSVKEEEYGHPIYLIADETVPGAGV